MVLEVVPANALAVPNDLEDKNSENCLTCFVTITIVRHVKL